MIHLWNSLKFVLHVSQFLPCDFLYFEETMLYSSTVVSQPKDYIRVSGTVEHI